METNLDKIKTFLKQAEVSDCNNINIDTAYLQLPKDFTILPTSEIVKYLNAIVQQKMYIRTLVSQSRAIYRECKSVYDKEKCRVFASAPPRMSVTEKELRVFNDEIAETARLRAEYALEKFDYLKDILESYEDGKFLVSRELSRRISDKDDTNRAGRFNA